MSEPEIARRCHLCGASIRERAFFCPQCGKELELRIDEPDASAIHDTQGIIINEGATLTEADFQALQKAEEITIKDGATVTEADFQAHQKTGAPRANNPPKLKTSDTQEIIINDGATLTEADFRARQKPPSAAASKHTKPGKAGVEERKTPAGQKALSEVGARIQRATTRARDVEGNVIHRVQQFREISSVVIDEAGYDPSLRFVLVAAALFLLFLVIVALNKMIA